MFQMLLAVSGEGLNGWVQIILAILGIAVLLGAVVAVGRNAERSATIKTLMESRDAYKELSIQQAAEIDKMNTKIESIQRSYDALQQAVSNIPAINALKEETSAMHQTIRDGFKLLSEKAAG